MTTAYLDTCIVSGLAKGDMDRREEVALLRILEARKRGTVALVTSEVAKAEIQGVPEAHRAKHQVIYNLLADVPTAKTHRTDSGLTLLGVGGGRLEDPLLSRLKALLPDAADADHVFQAAKNGVQYLVTTDRRTLIRHAAAVEQVSGVRVLSPTAFDERLQKSNDA